MGTGKSRDEIWQEWSDLVNMTPTELKHWLGSDESRSVGAPSGTGESVGHRSARRIVAIKETRKADLSDDDWDHMAKVVGYVKRHCAQIPEGDVRATNWRYSLMNWGHDPLKPGGCAEA